MGGEDCSRSNRELDRARPRAVGRRHKQMLIRLKNPSPWQRLAAHGGTTGLAAVKRIDSWNDSHALFNFAQCILCKLQKSNDA
ncbi:hypothetical protein RA210_U10198 [Rubrivivax sp. A210]|nr:hypothetical protein RA210_U10198 [Rubrivivax sp. A210]